MDRLNWGFEVSEPWRYNAPNDQYWDYPVVQGNQQSMHFAFLFNWANKPWLTQKWSRSIIDRYYGCGVANAYLGDEDQGQMSDNGVRNSCANIYLIWSRNWWFFSSSFLISVSSSSFSFSFTSLAL